MVSAPADKVSARLEFAHYYGDWYWNDGLTGWIKSLLLFFDGIALALPTDIASHFVESHPVLAQPLADLGLLRNYPPDLWLDPSWLETEPSILDNIRSSQYMSMTLPDKDLIYIEALENALDAADPGEFQFQFRKNLPEYAKLLTNAKQQYGGSPNLMRALSVGVSSGLLWRNVTDVAIQPVINHENAASFVASIIGSHDHGLARIVTGDLTHIGLDLSAVPLDEVLDFRRQHGAAYRAYSEEVRQFVLALSMIPDAERPNALINRHAALDDKAEELRRIARTAFKRRVMSLSFGLAGAAWTLAHGDTWGAMFAAGATAAGLPASTPGSIGAAYTYIVTASELTR